MGKNRISSKNQISEKVFWRIIFGVLLLFLTVCVVNPTFENDTFYIIKLGEQVLDSGLDLRDHWAWSADVIVTYPHIILNLILAVLFRAFGFEGVYVFVVVMGYVLALSIYYMMEKIYDMSVSESNLSLYPLIAVFVSIIVLVAFPLYIAARSQLLSYPLWLWESWFIFRFLNTGFKRYGIGIIVIAWLCALTHGTAWYFTFILFLPFLAAVYISKLFRRLALVGIKINSVMPCNNVIFSNDAECKNVKKLWIVLLISFATGLLTPTRICYTAIIKLANGKPVLYVKEHQPLVLAESKFVLIGILLFVVLLAFLKTRCRLDLLFLYSGTLIMSIFSVRHVGLFVFIGGFALFYLAFGAIALIPLSFREKVKKTIIPMLTVLVLAVTGLANNNLMHFMYLNPSFASDEAIDFLIEKYETCDLRLFNEYSYGAYMLFRGVPVFIDSRANEYTKQFDPELERDVFDDYVSIWKLQDNWREVVEYYDFDGYYIPKSCALYEVLVSDPNIELVWEDNYSVIFMTKK